MKKVAEIIADILVEKGIRHCFTLTGGGAMHMNDAFAHEEGLECVYFMHEQGAAIAAEGYARVNNDIPVVCVTTGPGGTNTITGVLCAWQDNIPMLIISGQVKTMATVKSTGLQLRQFGDQECDIVSTVSPMTKYAVTVYDAFEIRYHLEKAIHLAKSGRRGPVWIDVPLDIQGKLIDETQLTGYIPETESEPAFDEDIIRTIEKSTRPVILAGSAIRTSESYEVFYQLAMKLGIPVVVAKSIADILPTSNEMYFGNFGINGGRAGNFIVQNADCIIALGCRMSLPQIGFNYKEFSPNSTKIVVDVDENELKKATLKIDYPVHADLKQFIEWLAGRTIDVNCSTDWIDYCNELRDRFPIYQEKFGEKDKVNAYHFAHVIEKYLDEDAICICGNSCSSVSIKQCGVSGKDQRMWGNVNCGTMGYDIPATIGAAFAGHGRQVVCFAGDGSFQLNIQELQTIVNYNLPVKLFVFNNNGYRSIQISQTKNFGRMSGCTEETGLKLPKIEKIAYAYDIPYFLIEANNKLDEMLSVVLEHPGFAICEVIEDESHVIEPKLGNKILEDGSIVSPTLIDLEPYLDKQLYDRFADFNIYGSER